VDVPVPDSVLKTVKVARTALDAEKIINLPVLKAHCQAKLTCGMKNLMGVIPDSEKRRFHTVDLDRAVFELNTVLSPALNICDAVIGDLTFEEGGTPVEFGRVFMGADIYAFDCYAAAVLGYEPDEIGYLRHYRKFYGKSGPFPVSRLNEPRTEERFEARDYRSRYACRFNVRNACCSCLASVFTALEADKKAASGLTFHVGKGVGRGEGNRGGLDVFVGRCTQPFSGGGVHVPGCPPDGNAVRSVLRLKN
jgi:uncharacterized protein (DUF362 family)